MNTQGKKTFGIRTSMVVFSSSLYRECIKTDKWIINELPNKKTLRITCITIPVGSMLFMPEATLKKKFVSCPAGGHNSGHSGGRKIFFFLIYFLHCIEIIWKMLNKKRKISKMWKKCTHSPLISSPGRWTGNRIIFKGGLIHTCIAGQDPSFPGSV